ncbi:hypothetical protein BDA99DRAFT_492311 [Phascolomyces articulosus]|uniref:Small nuclear ribonucleoprotein Prp3 C-terminal domain-containing protein n=1 Tax=Phascolomyces articulosus TaxID=60185 RepID=A0AAD5PKT1_9FUNG|nr:hypothetical protein BDA99DRAFT_492311 [Phascolomyces articulosus]
MSNLTIDNVENVVNVVELLKSMYYGEDEFSFRSDRDSSIYNELQQLNEAGTVSNTTVTFSDSISFEIKLTLTVCDQELPLSLFCQLSIRQSAEYDLAIASANSAWLSREDHGSLSELLQTYEPSTTPDEDRASCILEKIQYIQGEAETMAEKSLQEQEANARKKMTKDEGPCTFLREWIWFPMIYTREKRGHIIDWAPKYKITGFLCPGKPGAMCLEGKEKDVARFINDIKTVSWSDIPASHRKMTSKWQEKTECESLAAMQALRRFPDMKEYKFDIHGQFANHNDLNKLQDWMKEMGCAEAFDHLFDYDLQN